MSNDPLVGVNAPAGFDPNRDRAQPGRGTDLREIIMEIRDDLVKFLDWPKERVVVVADRKFNPRALAESHIRVRPLRRKIEENPGAGRLAALRIQMVAIDVIVRVAADDAASDEQAMLHPQTGLLALDDRVVDCLNLRLLERMDKRLVVQPIAETNADDPNRPSPGEGFAAVTLYFEARYFPRHHIRWA